MMDMLYEAGNMPPGENAKLGMLSQSKADTAQQLLPSLQDYAANGS